MNFNNFRT